MRLLIVDLTDRWGTEAEPVRVEHVPGPMLGMRFVLDDGTELLFDARELLAAVVGEIDAGRHGETEAA